MLSTLLPTSLWTAPWHHGGSELSGPWHLERLVLAYTQDTAKRQGVSPSPKLRTTLPVSIIWGDDQMGEPSLSSNWCQKKLIFSYGIHMDGENKPSIIYSWSLEEHTLPPLLSCQSLLHTQVIFTYVLSTCAILYRSTSLHVYMYRHREAYTHRCCIDTHLCIF